MGDIAGPRPAQVYETVLYAADLRAAVAFYRDVLGLRVLREPDELMAVLDAGGGGVLLLFEPAVSARPGRLVPSHGATGQGHVAFSVPADGLAAFTPQLERHGVAVEQEVRWSPRARSVYVRDPAGNSVELVEGELWREAD